MFYTTLYLVTNCTILTNKPKVGECVEDAGHTNTRMTLHYAHIMNDTLAQEMNKVAAIIGE